MEPTCTASSYNARESSVGVFFYVNISSNCWTYMLLNAKGSSGFFFYINNSSNCWTYVYNQLLKRKREFFSILIFLWPWNLHVRPALSTHSASSGPAQQSYRRCCQPESWSFPRIPVGPPTSGPSHPPMDSTRKTRKKFTTG